MQHNRTNKTILVSLTALLCSIALGTFLWKVHQDRWKAQHDGSAVVLPTPTSYPHLDPAESQAHLIELFRSNGDCRFPCWWGIVPGKATWQEAHASLSPFMDAEVGQFLSDDGTVTTVAFYSSLPVFIEEDIQEDGRVFGHLIEDVPADYISNLKLSSIFQMYGRPGGIYIRSPHKDMGDNSCRAEFELFLYYPANHFAIRYSYFGYRMNQPIQVCGLDQPDSTDFYLWDPAFDYASFEEASKFTGWFPQEQIVPIEEATSWTTESFYQAFRSQAGATFCIEAPAYDWSHLPGIGPGQTPYPFCNGPVPTKTKFYRHKTQ